MTDMSSIIVFEFDIDKMTDFRLKMIIHQNESFHNNHNEKIIIFLPIIY